MVRCVHCADTMGTVQCIGYRTCASVVRVTDTDVRQVCVFVCVSIEKGLIIWRYLARAHPKGFLCMLWLCDDKSIKLNCGIEGIYLSAVPVTRASSLRLVLLQCQYINFLFKMEIFGFSACVYAFNCYCDVYFGSWIPFEIRFVSLCLRQMRLEGRFFFAHSMHRGNKSNKLHWFISMNQGLSGLA